MKVNNKGKPKRFADIKKRWRALGALAVASAAAIVCIAVLSTSDDAVCSAELVREATAMRLEMGAAQQVDGLELAGISVEEAEQDAAVESVLTASADSDRAGEVEQLSVVGDISVSHTITDRAIVGDELTLERIYESRGYDNALIPLPPTNLPLYCLNPDGDYYVALVDGLRDTDRAEVQDYELTIGGDVVEGTYFDSEEGLLYIPKTAIDNAQGDMSLHLLQLAEDEVMPIRLDSQFEVIDLIADTHEGYEINTFLPEVTILIESGLYERGLSVALNGYELTLHEDFVYDTETGALTVAEFALNIFSIVIGYEEVPARYRAGSIIENINPLGASELPALATIMPTSVAISPFANDPMSEMPNNLRFDVVGGSLNPPQGLTGPITDEQYAVVSGPARLTGSIAYCLQRGIPAPTPLHNYELLQPAGSIASRIMDHGYPNNPDFATQFNLTSAQARGATQAVVFATRANHADTIYVNISDIGSDGSALGNRMRAAVLWLYGVANDSSVSPRYYYFVYRVSGAQNMILTFGVPRATEMRVNKFSSDTSITGSVSSMAAGNSLYSVEGFVFELYTTQAQAQARLNGGAGSTETGRVARWVTNAEGQGLLTHRSVTNGAVTSNGRSGDGSRTLSLVPGVYWLIEQSVPSASGFTHDTTVRRIDVRECRAGEGNRNNNMWPVRWYNDPSPKTEMRVSKFSSNTWATNNNPHYSTEGIAFELYTTQAQAQARLNGGAGNAETGRVARWVTNAQGQGELTNRSATNGAITIGGRSAIGQRTLALEPGIYWLIEQSVPYAAGYVHDRTPQRIDLRNQGAGSGHRDPTVWPFRWYNAPILGSIHTTKSSVSTGGYISDAIFNANPNYSLVGAVFGVWRTEAAANAANQSGANFMGTKTVGANGVATMNGLPMGDYFIREVQAPPGHALSDEIVGIQLRPSGQSAISRHAQYRNERQFGTDVVIYKRDSETGERIAQGGASLAGAIFELRWADPTAPNGMMIQRIVTDATGRARYYANPQQGRPGIPVGTFWVREYQAPDGYLVCPRFANWVPFEVCNALGAPRVIAIQLSATVDNVYEQVKRGNLSFIKTNVDDREISEGLEGVQFEIIDRNEYNGDGVRNPNYNQRVVINGIQGILTTDRYGFACTSDLIPANRADWGRYNFTGGFLVYGEYILRELGETTPEALWPIRDFVFTVSQNGVTQRFVVNNFNAEYFLQFVKVDATTGQIIPLPMTGQLRRGAPDGPLVSMTTIVDGERVSSDTWTTNTRGFVQLPETVRVGVFYFVETQAPFGYVLHDPIRIEIHRDLPRDEVVTIVVENDPVMGQLDLLKGISGETTRTAEGTTFHIYARYDIVTADGSLRFYAGDLADVVVIGEDGTGQSRELFLNYCGVGRYKVKEVSTTPWLVLNPEVWYVDFTFEDQYTRVVFEELTVYNELVRTAVRVLKNTIERTTIGYRSPPGGAGIDNTAQGTKEMFQYDVNFRSESNCWADELFVIDNLEGVNEGMIRVYELWTPVVYGSHSGTFNLFYQTSVETTAVPEVVCHMASNPYNPTNPYGQSRFDLEGWHVWGEGLDATEVNHLMVEDLELGEEEYITRIALAYGKVYLGFTTKNTGEWLPLPTDVWFSQGALDAEGLEPLIYSVYAPDYLSLIDPETGEPRVILNTVTAHITRNIELYDDCECDTRTYVVESFVPEDDPYIPQEDPEYMYVSVGTQAHTGDGETQTFPAGSVFYAHDIINLRHFNVPIGHEGLIDVLFFERRSCGEVVLLWKSENAVDYAVAAEIMQKEYKRQVDHGQLAACSELFFAEILRILNPDYVEGESPAHERYLFEYSHNLCGTCVNQTLTPVSEFEEEEEEEEVPPRDGEGSPRTGDDIPARWWLVITVALVGFMSVSFSLMHRFDEEARAGLEKGGKQAT